MKPKSIGKQIKRLERQYYNHILNKKMRKRIERKIEALLKKN
jgi:hypothetical protein